MLAGAPRRSRQHDALNPGRAAVIQETASDRVELTSGRADVVYEQDTLNGHEWIAPATQLANAKPAAVELLASER